MAQRGSIKTNLRSKTVLTITSVRSHVTVEILEESRPDNVPFGSLIVNGRHVWRFQTTCQAELAMGNLKKALEGEE